MPASLPMKSLPMVGSPASAAPRARAVARRITLIRPHMLIPRYSFTGLTVPPLGLAYVASSLAEQGHQVTLIDAVGEAIEHHAPFREDYVLHGLATEQILERIPSDTELIGLSCMFSHEFPIYRDLIQAVRARFPGVPILAGGEHVTALPGETFAQCEALDVAVIGEGEETMLDLAASDFSPASLASIPGIVWRDGSEVRTNPRRARVRDIDSFAKPAWHLVPVENYWKYGMGLGVNRGRSMPMLATRGCPYQCTFCSNPLMWTTRWSARRPDAVLDEMRTYVEKYGVENFDFYDLTAIVKKAWTVEFAEKIVGSGLKFTYQLPSGTRSEAIDQEVARLLYKSGCRNMTYAPESGSPKTLKRIKKKIKVSSMLSSIRACRREGLNIKANIIVGFPDEKKRDLVITYGFILRMALAGIHDVTIQPFSAYPGTELFDELRATHKIPQLDDEYFFTLADYSDLSKSISWSEHLSRRDVLIFRSIGMVSFYILSYLVRPWRFFIVMKNLLQGRQESRLERALSDVFQRKKALAADVVSASPRLQPPYI
jgi:anaerobic magnesium-protoporphyrin IX monomethyl ester cyclase